MSCIHRASAVSRALALVFALLAIAPARAAEQSSIVQPTSGPHSAADLANNYLNPALRALLGNSNGPTAPANGPAGAPALGQWWMDTSSSPYALRMNDGAQFPILATLDAAGHMWSLLPPSAGYRGGVFAATAPSHQFVTGVNTSGSFIFVQPAVNDLLGFGSGVAAALGLPANGAGSFPVLDVNGRLSAALITYQSSLTGALPNSLAKVLDNIVIATNYMSAAQQADIASCGGTIDIAATMNQIAANHSGMTIILPRGMYRFDSEFDPPAATAIEGVGWRELVDGAGYSLPCDGTIIWQNYLASYNAYGIHLTGTHSAVRHLEIRQTQPTLPANPIAFTGTITSGSPTVSSVSSTTGLAVNQLVEGAGIPARAHITAIGSGTITLSDNATASTTGVALSSNGWVPNIGPWAIAATATPYLNEGGHRPVVEDVLLRNCYDCILTENVRGGEFHQIYGQPLNTGLFITGNGDEPHLSDIHFGWAYWTGNSAVLKYRLAHATDYMFGRVDNPKTVNLFSWGPYVGVRSFFNTGPTPDYTGAPSAVSLVSVEVDGPGKYGIAVEDNSDVSIVNANVFPSASFDDNSCLVSYGVSNPSASGLNQRLRVQGFQCTNPGGYAFVFTYAPPGTPAFPQYLSLSNIRVTDHRGSPWTSGFTTMYAIPGLIVRGNNLAIENGAGQPWLTDTSAVLGGGGTLLWEHGEQNFQGNVTAYSFTALSTAPSYNWANSSAGADQKKWSGYVDSSGTWHLLATNDAGDAGTDAISVTRTGYAPALIALNAPTTVPTPGTSDNSTRVVTSAWWNAQLGVSHIWTATQTFSADISIGGSLISGPIGSWQANLYYAGGWKYYANGFGSQFTFDNTNGGVCLYAAPVNAGGAGAAAFPVKQFCVTAAGAVAFDAYTTAGVIANDASGNLSSIAGFTGTKTVRASGGASDCTMTFTKGVLTGGTC